MKLSVKADIELEVQFKDVIAFLEEDKLKPEEYDTIIFQAMRRKKGFFTMSDQMKVEIFERVKERFTPEEFEQRLL